VRPHHIRRPEVNVGAPNRCAATRSHAAFSGPYVSSVTSSTAGSSSSCSGESSPNPGPAGTAYADTLEMYT